jgi:hypothetical protein
LFTPESRRPAQLFLPADVGSATRPHRCPIEIVALIAPPQRSRFTGVSAPAADSRCHNRPTSSRRPACHIDAKKRSPTAAPLLLMSAVSAPPSPPNSPAEALVAGAAEKKVSLVLIGDRRPSDELRADRPAWPS